MTVSGASQLYTVPVHHTAYGHVLGTYDQSRGMAARIPSS
jgi:hypothetical protein